jgi:RNA polymerase sigma-70 factor (ECF subfamily)
MEAETMEATGTRASAHAPRPAPTGDAFSQAISEHHRSLTRFAYALCGDVTQAEDIVAEAYARTWPRWRRGRVDNLYGYLRRAVANETYGRHRRRRLERREAERRTPPGPDGQFEAEVDGREMLWDALARLSPRLRVIVVLRIVEDLSEAQTAAMLDIRPGTVKSRMSRALTLLRRTVDNGEG